MRILVTGSTGLLGRALGTNVTRSGGELLRLVRGPGNDQGCITWDPLTSGPLRDDRLENLDAVVHLAGENIAGRWTTAKKERILASRVRGTQRLVQTLSALRTPPPALLCASAVGFYGDTGDRIVDETAPRGRGFLAEVCEAWEAEAARAADAGIRSVRLRLGMVLDAHGGALAKMLPPFRMGLGGPVGHGRQLMSWITLADAVHAIQHVIGNGDLQGPVNLAAPYPIPNRTFAKALGNALHRPARMPLPAVAVRALFGEMGSSLLLGSIGAEPSVLIKSGFEFASGEIDKALADVLGS